MGRTFRRWPFHWELCWCRLRETYGSTGLEFGLQCSYFCLQSPVAGSGQSHCSCSWLGSTQRRLSTLWWGSGGLSVSCSSSANVLLEGRRKFASQVCNRHQYLKRNKITKMRSNIKIYLPSFLFSIRRFLMDPLTGEYQLLEAKTWTFSNSDGFEFLVEKTFPPPMEME